MNKLNTMLAAAIATGLMAGSAVLAQEEGSAPAPTGQEQPAPTKTPPKAKNTKKAKHHKNHCKGKHGCNGDESGAKPDTPKPGEGQD